MDKIAVIIPVYNSDPWLQRCLDSVLAAADAHTDIYIVDDGSEDMSPVIASRYAADHPNVRFIQQKNEGAGAARAKGVQAAADAQWICFVDSDDTIPRDAIQLLRQNISDQYDIISGNLAISSGEGVTLVEQGNRREYSSQEFVVELLENRMLGVVYGRLIRRELFDRIDWDTHRSLTNHEDAMLMLHLGCAMTRRAVVISTILVYNYIRRPGSLSTMLTLKYEGVERLWNSVKQLDVPRESLVRWGLGILDMSFINRGLEFPNSYAPAAELRRMARGMRLKGMHRRREILLYSKALRHRVMRKRLLNGDLSSVSPHISFIIVVHDDVKGLRRTLKSIFDTAFRNIEIIIVDDASSQASSIRINELHVKYRRIHLIKTPRRVGASQARKMALKQAHAVCTMFLNTGDTIEARGIFEAISLIDAGNDMVFMGRRAVSTFSRSRIFNPDMSHLPADEIPEAVLKYVLENFSFEAPLGGIVLRHSALSDDDFPTSDDLVTPHVHEFLTRISLQLRPQRYALLPTLGYNRLKRRSENLSPAARWERDLTLALHIARFLGEADAPEYYANVLRGLHNALVLSASRIAANPLKSAKSLRRFLDAAMDNPAMKEVYEFTETTPGVTLGRSIARDELVDILVDESRDFARKNRSIFPKASRLITRCFL